MNQFLTVTEAAQLIGKSASSIRRLIYPILEANRHPDRPHIQPDAATAKSLRSKGENFAWKISREFLDRVISEDSAKAKPQPKKNTESDHSLGVIIEILRAQLEIKDRQIAAQNELLQGLTEGARQSNLIIGSLQKQLVPPSTTDRSNATIVTASASPQTQEQGSQAPVTTPKKHWLFRNFF